MTMSAKKARLPRGWLPYGTVKAARAAGHTSGTLANGDTFGSEDDLSPVKPCRMWAIVNTSGYIWGDALKGRKSECIEYFGRNDDWKRARRNGYRIMRVLVIPDETPKP